jgi:hypothetical protein
MAMVLNAYVHPVVSRYIGKLESGLRTRGLQGPLLNDPLQSCQKIIR